MPRVYESQSFPTSICKTSLKCLTVSFHNTLTWGHYFFPSPGPVTSSDYTQLDPQAAPDKMTTLQLYLVDLALWSLMWPSLESPVANQTPVQSGGPNWAVLSKYVINYSPHLTLIKTQFEINLISCKLFISIVHVDIPMIVGLSSVHCTQRDQKFITRWWPMKIVTSKMNWLPREHPFARTITHGIQLICKLKQ